MELPRTGFTRYNVCTKLEYLDAADGKQKTKWYKTGTMRVYPSGAIMIRRFDHPGMDYYCFEQQAPAAPAESPMVSDDQE